MKGGDPGVAGLETSGFFAGTDWEVGPRGLV